MEASQSNSVTIKRNGYSLVELLLAMVVGTVVLGAAYSSYFVIAHQHSLLAARSQIQESALPTLHLLERHTRSAGLIAMDSNLDPVFSSIADPIVITDSNNACCDQLRITYDLSDGTAREQVTFFVMPRTAPVRNALFMDIDQWNGVSWTNTVNDALVVDYVDDFQAEISSFTLTGRPKTIDLSMILHSPIVLNAPRTFTKPSYNVGNFDFTATENFFRDAFQTTVYIRNTQ